jgi:hypothetical protein
MDQKKLYFIIATTSFLAGAGAKTVADFVPGVDQAIVSVALAGTNETRDHSFKLDAIPSSLLNMINNYLTTTECPKVNARYGDGVCDGASMPFTIRLNRKAGGVTSVDGIVRDIPVFTTVRPPVEPTPPEEP